MMPSSHLAAEIREWMERAAADLRMAELALSASPPLRREALFHCQQTVEKALKAFLTWHQEVFDRTHDLGKLARACLRLDASLESVVAPASGLTPYATRFRYPGAPYEPDDEEAKQALAFARDTLEQIRVRLPAE